MKHAIFCIVLVASFAASADPARVTTLAGTGEAGYSGDGGPATAAKCHEPNGSARGPDGSLYFCDTLNHAIRRIAPDGTLSTVAGTGKKGYSGDNGPATKGELAEPYEVRCDASGNLFVAERLNHCVRRIDGKTQLITTLAGNGKSGSSGDGGPAAASTFKEPHSLQFDKSGDLFICDVADQRIRKLEMKTGIVTTFAGTGGKGPVVDGAKIAGTPLSGPRAIDFDVDGNLWVALREGNAVLKLDVSAAVIHLAAGTGKKGFTGDGGPARDATLNGPKGIACGPDGNVYIADTENHAIRMIDIRKGTIKLVVGAGAKGDGPDGDPLQCKLARPHGIFIDRDGTILIGDTENQRLRAVRR